MAVKGEIYLCDFIVFLWLKFEDGVKGESSVKFLEELGFNVVVYSMILL